MGKGIRMTGQSAFHRLAVSAVAALAVAGPLAATSLAGPAAAQSQRGPRDAQAEAFVQNEASQVITILGDKSLSLAVKKQRFRAMIDQVADVPRVSSYVLGKYNRTITPQQKQEFAAAFREFANGVYESRLGQYKGESVRVTGSIVRRPGDVIVSSQIVGGGRARPVQVSWRVLKNDDGRWRAVDVEVAGVWLAITQQQDFVSTIDNAGGNIDVLIRQLRSQAARNNAGA